MGASSDSAFLSDISTADAYRRRIAELEARLGEAEDTLDAIRSGEVDAVVVGPASGQRIYTLESADRSYRLLIEQMREGALMLSPERVVLYCNQALAELLRTPFERIVGTSFDRFVPDEALGELIALIGGDGKAEVMLVPDGAAPIPARLSASSVALESGRVTCAVITSLVEERAHARELAAAAAKLAQSQKLETIGQLTGGVAHDFNNLLTPVLGNLDLLQRQHADARSQRLIGNALQASERAKILVQRLLAFARRQSLEARAVDVGALIDGIADLVRGSIGPQIEVAIEVEPNLPAAQVDPNQLELALLNLSVNARDAMPDGGVVTVRAAAGRVDGGNALGLAAGDYVRVSVTDTGAGMDEATLARAVEPFFSTKGVGKGTGLGLSMVHGLAAQSGGALHIASAPGEGACAELWLPVADAPAAAPDASDEAAAGLRPMSILLVDDEELVRTGTAELLAELGHRVTQAGSGAAALELLRGGAACDLLITDYLMPGMRGDALAAEARGMRPGIGVLLVTGYAQLEDCEAAGLPRLAKPFRAADLAKRLAEVMGGEVSLVGRL